MIEPHDARDGHLPELAQALRHLSGQDAFSPAAPPTSSSTAHADLVAETMAGVRQAAIKAYADRLAALLAEIAGRCQPPVELLPEDVGPEHHRLPSELQAEGRRLTARLGLPAPAVLLDPMPDEPLACRARFELLLSQLTELEGNSVRVTDARLRFGRRT